MKIVTGYGGAAHITSNDDQGRNMAVFGDGCYVSSVGNRFAATAASVNEIQIADGEGFMHGVQFRIEPGTYDSVTIDNGTQDMERIDLIVAQYTKDTSTGIETVELAVIKGEEAESAEAPSYTDGDIRSGTELCQMPLWQVKLSGISIESLTSLFTIVPDLTTTATTEAAGLMSAEDKETLDTLNSSLNDEASLTNRYIKLPNGLIICWGRFTPAATSTYNSTSGYYFSTNTLTLPINIDTIARVFFSIRTGDSSKQIDIRVSGESSPDLCVKCL